jgi:hypothetical protein
MERYSDYLEVRSDYIPVYSIEEDGKAAGTWKHFIPHDSMKRIIEDLYRALKRGSSDDTRSLWINGAYGTGKTFASFVLKHILEDDVEEVRDYFEKQNLQSLWKKFSALRENKNYLVIHRSGSDTINSPEKLLIEVQHSIREALKKKGYTYLGYSSVVDTILERLNSGKINWEAIFNDPQYRFPEFGQYANAQEVIAALPHNTNLAERVGAVLEKEGVIFANKIDSVKRWIADIIAKNGLDSGGIIFIWDEFTDYFRRNNVTSSLQELAHLTSSTRFYLVLITHKTIDQISSIDTDTRSRLKERFHNILFDMNVVTAYQLIGNAIRVHPAALSKWDVKSVALWDSVDINGPKFITIDENMKVESLKKLLPIHPVSAFLLTHISRLFSSSQRTLFRFLKEKGETEDKEKRNYNWFIKNHGFESEWQWLTPDYLWDYFFMSDTLEFSESVRQHIAHFQTHIDRLKDDVEMRVFKAAMLLLVMSKETGLKTTDANIFLAFSGQLSQSQVTTALNRLIEEMGVITATPGDVGERILLLPLGNIDLEKLNTEKNKLKTIFDFNKLADSFHNAGYIGQRLIDAFSGDKLAETRIKKGSTSSNPQYLKAAINKMTNGLLPHEMGVLFVLVEKEEGLHSLDTVIKNQGVISQRIIIIPVKNAFTSKNLEDWYDQKAREDYARQLRDRNMEVHKKNADDIIARWVEQIKNSRLSAYYKDQEYKDNIDGFTGLLELIHKLISVEYKYGPESICKTTTVYKSGGEQAVLAGMKEVNPSGGLPNVITVLNTQGFWDAIDDTIFDIRADHPVSRLYSFIKKEIENCQQLYLCDLWIKVMEPPYGLSNNMISLFLFGFVMRPYVRGGYYLNDGVKTIPLTTQSLAKGINAVVKQSRGYDKYFITTLRDNDKLFCSNLKKIFSLKDEEAGHPDDLQRSIRIRINTKQYPFWAISHLPVGVLGGVQDQATKEKIQNVVEQINLFVIFDQENKARQQEIIDNVINSIKTCLVSPELLGELFNQSLSKGMEKYIKTVSPEILTESRTLGLDFSQMMERFRNKYMQEEVWTWKPDDVNSRLKDYLVELRLINTVNYLLNMNLHTLEQQQQEIKKFMAMMKVPGSVIFQQDTDWKDAFKVLWSFENCPDLRIFTSDKQHELTKAIKVWGQDVWNCVKNQKDVLKEWLIKNGKSIDEGDLNELYSNIQTWGVNGNTETFRGDVINTLNKLSIQSLYNRLIELWNELTGCESVDEWCEKNTIPIKLVDGMNTQEMIQLFETLRSKNRSIRFTEEILKNNIAILEKQQSRFAILKDQKELNNALLRAVVQGNESIIANYIDELKNFLKKEMDTPVYTWNDNFTKLQQLGKRFIAEKYNSDLKPKVYSKIQNMNEKQVKEYLIQLINNSAQIGLEILKSH